VHGGAGTDESRLTNRGLLLYKEFNEVVVLTTCHRVTLDVQHLQGAEAEAYRSRAQRFVELLHKVRDLTLTRTDYFELCKRKRAFLSLRERQAFDQAPVMMDFRKDTASTADGNCELYNRRQVRALARRQRVPVIAWDAWHEGVRQEDAPALLPVAAMRVALLKPPLLDDGRSTRRRLRRRRGGACWGKGEFEQETGRNVG
jgi:hypothetical protein